MEVIPTGIVARIFLERYARMCEKHPEFAQCADFIRCIGKHVDDVLIYEKGQLTLPNLIGNTFFTSTKDHLEEDARAVADLINSAGLAH